MSTASETIERERQRRSFGDGTGGLSRSIFGTPWQEISTENLEAALADRRELRAEVNAKHEAQVSEIDREIREIEAMQEAKMRIASGPAATKLTGHPPRHAKGAKPSATNAIMDLVAERGPMLAGEIKQVLQPRGYKVGALSNATSTLKAKGRLAQNAMGQYAIAGTSATGTQTAVRQTRKRGKAMAQ